MSKLIVWSLGAFVIFFIAFRPENASIAVRRIAEALSVVASGVSQFVAGVVG